MGNSTKGWVGQSRASTGVQRRLNVDDHVGLVRLRLGVGDGWLVLDRAIDESV
jgi:hypothetical protein